MIEGALADLDDGDSVNTARNRHRSLKGYVAPCNANAFLRVFPFQIFQRVFRLLETRVGIERTMLPETDFS